MKNTTRTRDTSIMAAAGSKVIIITGASRGIGHCVATALLKSTESPRVVLVSRTEAPMAALRDEFPDRVEVVTADLGGDDEVSVNGKS